MKSGNDPILNFLSDSITPVRIKPPEWRLEPENRIFFSGSCFASELFGWCLDRGLLVNNDPFGPIFNPQSLSECLGFLVEGRELDPNDFFEHDGVWRHPLFNTLKSNRDLQRLKDLLNSQCSEARKVLQEADYLCLTVGTAWCYRNRESGKIVNNCHKLPADYFERFCLTHKESSEILVSLRKKLKDFNPGLNIIVSLSPVRHLRDNPEENSLSKAILRCALKDLCDEGSWYFPAWEIMMDELRDYRWYASDLVHPSVQAVSYILTRFMNTVGSSSLQSYLKESEQLYRDFRHISFDPESPATLAFQKGLSSRLDALAFKYPALKERLFQHVFPKK